MIFDISNMPLIEEYKTARGLESLAVNDMLTTLKSGERDEDVLNRLIDSMEKARGAAMDIWNRLEKVAIGR